jgi:hypothetical protein
MPDLRDIPKISRPSRAVLAAQTRSPALLSATCPEPVEEERSSRFSGVNTETQRSVYLNLINLKSGSPAAAFKKCQLLSATCSLAKHVAVSEPLAGI